MTYCVVFIEFIAVYTLNQINEENMKIIKLFTLLAAVSISYYNIIIVLYAYRQYYTWTIYYSIYPWEYILFKYLPINVVHYLEINLKICFANILFDPH